jgi:hypothetical protein
MMLTIVVIVALGGHSSSLKGCRRCWKRFKSFLHVLASVVVIEGKK